MYVNSVKSNNVYSFRANENSEIKDVKPEENLRRHIVGNRCFRRTVIFKPEKMGKRTVCNPCRRSACILRCKYA